MRRAPELGGGFLGVVDTDELLVPYGAGCLPQLLATCTRRAQMQTVASDGTRAERRCAGILLNRMMVRTCAGVGAAANVSFLGSAGFALGSLEPLTKSIVRLDLPAADFHWSTPHAPLLRGATAQHWCLVDEVWGPRRALVALACTPPDQPRLTAPHPASPPPRPPACSAAWL